jgi:hypothetical protein
MGGCDAAGGRTRAPPPPPTCPRPSPFGGPPYALNFSTDAPDGSLGTSSPAACAATAAVGSAAPACLVGPATAQDPQAFLSKYGCSSACAASADPRCSPAWLSATFGAVPSVYAAFCNDAYLVLLASSDPGFLGNLDSIVFPPREYPMRTAPRAAPGPPSVGSLQMRALRMYLRPSLLPAASPANNQASSMFRASQGRTRLP